MKPLLKFLTFAALLLVGNPHAGAQFTVERVVGNLNQPIYMTQAPGDDNSLYIVERADPGNAVGRILKYDQQSQTKTTFLDLSGTIDSDGGALSLAFHPEYQTNGRFYITLNDDSVNRLEEYQLIEGVPQFQRTLLEYNNLANTYHTINWIGFRPGGNNNELFVTAGDGGTQANQGSFDPALIESPDSPYGKLLRVNLLADFSGGPAPGPTHPGVDVMALGLRNPYRASFDRVTGDMYIGDVGFNTAEEVDFIPSSFFSNPMSPLDFGWTDREGTVETVASQAGGPGSPGDIDPIFDYAHSGQPLPHQSLLHGGSITGGYLYRGPVPELQGRYFFGDFLTQEIYSGTFDTSTPQTSYDGTNLTNIQNHTSQFEDASTMSSPSTWLTSFAEDNAGNLYVVDFGESFFPPLGEGEIYRVMPLSEITMTVDRTTGTLTLTNFTGAPTDIVSYEITSAVGAIDPLQLTPIAGNYDASAMGDGSVDDNDEWEVVSPPGSNTSFAEQTTGDAGTLAIDVSKALSIEDAWIRSPIEDLQLSITLDGGAMLTGRVVYVGNNSNAFARSDLNFDGTVGEDDWPVFRDNFQTDLSGLSKAQSFGRGDLDGDGDSDYDDFLLFRNDFDAANGIGAFQALTNVPEPTTLSGAALLSAIGFAGRRCKGRFSPK